MVWQYRMMASRRERFTSGARARLRAIGLAGCCLALHGCATALAGLAPTDASRPCRMATTPGGLPAAMAWAPTPAGEAAIVEAWCAAAGPPVVVTRPRDSESTGFVAAPPTDLAVVSWNVHVGGGDVEALIERLRRGEFTAGRPVRDFVLLLQEVHRAGHLVPAVLPARSRVAGAIRPRPPHRQREDIVAVAERLGLSLLYAPSMRNGAADSREDRGNAILSSEPLHDPTAIELPYGRQRRVALAASIDVAAGDGASTRLRLATVHLEVAARARHLWVFGGLRQRQARRLLDALPGDEPLVLAGDFNTWFGFADRTYRTIAREIPDAAKADRRPTFKRWLRLDHLFSRPPDGWITTVRRLDDAHGSDHYPLLALFRPAAGTARPAAATEPQD